MTLRGGVCCLFDRDQLHDADVIAIACHPHRNIMASVSVDGTLKVWKAESLVD